MKFIFTTFFLIIFFSTKVVYSASFTFPSTLTTNTSDFVLLSETGTTPSVSGFSTSIHSKKNYPLKKQLSNLDIELDEGIKDDEYLKIVFKALEEMNKKKFDYVFYVAGVDVHEDDRIGKFKISTEGIKKREELVIHNFYKKRIPLCGVLGGGYNKDFNQLVYLHSLLHRTCHNLLHYEY